MKGKLLRLVAAGGCVAGAMLPAAAAHASYGNPGGGGTSNSGGGTSAQSTGSSDGGTLPFTGGDVLGVVVLGAGLAAGGTVLVRANRRRASTL
jgi:hypothetical protein